MGAETKGNSRLDRIASHMVVTYPQIDEVTGGDLQIDCLALFPPFFFFCHIVGRTSEFWYLIWRSG